MPERNAFKGTSGLHRLKNALKYSMAGFRAAWLEEEAFRQILCVALISWICAVLLAQNWLELVMLILPSALCIIVELLNSSLENLADSITLEQHDFIKKAKDMGSAAQCAAQTFLCIVWITYLVMRLFHPDSLP